MNITTVRIIPVSEVFDGEPDLLDEWNEVCPFTFGDANRTLINIRRFSKEVTNIWDMNGAADDILDLLDLMPDDIYIDLEN